MTRAPSHDRLARLVTNDHGTWDVVHPFTGRVEFSTDDKSLAEAVRDEFDRRDPQTVKWLFEALYELPPHARSTCEWVMSEATGLRIRRLCAPSDGYFTDLPPLYTREVVLLGKKVVFDESALGVTLREAK